MGSLQIRSKPVLRPKYSSPANAPFFTDNFSSGNINKQLNGQAFWGGGNTNVVGVVDCSLFPSPGGATKCVKMYCGTATPPGNANNDPEIDFYLGGGYSHLWIRLYAYYPSGSESPTLGPAWGRTNTSATNNNKLFRFGEATTWAGSSVRMGMSTYGNSSNPNIGCDQANFEFAGSSAGVIQYDQPGNSGRCANANLGNKALGGWVKLEMELQINTTTPTVSGDGFGLSNGVMTFWVNDTQIIQLTNVGMAPTGTLIQCGYLFGAMNMTPDNANSNFYFTDFAVSSTGRA